LGVICTADPIREAPEEQYTDLHDHGGFHSKGLTLLKEAEEYADYTISRWNIHPHSSAKNAQIREDGNIG